MAEFAVPIDDPRPSQLYLNGRKLALATEWFDFDDPHYDPVSVLEGDGGLYLTDGHTRAFLAYLAGADELRVRYDPDEPDLDLDLYAACLGWCGDEGIVEIADLAGRVVNADTFEERWVARCEAAAED